MTTTLLPDHIHCPQPKSAYEAHEMSQAWAKAQTLFRPNPFGQPTDNYDYVASRTDNSEIVLVSKPRLRDHLPDYTDRPYRVDIQNQTCDCPYFAGVPERVHPVSGKCLPAQPGHGYCKHVFAVLYTLHLTGTLPGLDTA